MGQVIVCPWSPSQNPSWWHQLWEMVSPSPFCLRVPWSMPISSTSMHWCQLPLSLDPVSSASLTPFLQWQVSSASHPSAPSGLCNNLSSFLGNPLLRCTEENPDSSFSERAAKHTKSSITQICEGSTGGLDWVSALVRPCPEEHCCGGHWRGLGKRKEKKSGQL